MRRIPTDFQERAQSQATLKRLHKALGSLRKLASLSQDTLQEATFSRSLKWPLQGDDETWGNREETSLVILPADLEEALHISGQIAEIIDRVSYRILKGATYRKDRIEEIYLGDRASVHFKSLFLLLETRPVLRGFLEVRQSIAMVGPSCQSAAFAFIGIPGLDDLLDRENHHSGYHYHYCDRKGKRSNTILCFEAKTPPSGSPLRWQLHGPGTVKARANAWRDPKRLSVYKACEPDLKTWKPSDFQRPGKHSELLWPK